MTPRKPLHPCPACARHVRESDAACPFCGAPAAQRKPATRRIGGPLGARAAYIAGASTLTLLAGTLEACKDPSKTIQQNTMQAVPPYGVSPPVHPTGPVRDPVQPIEPVQKPDASAPRGDAGIPVPVHATPPYGVSPKRRQPGEKADPLNPYEDL